MLQLYLAQSGLHVPAVSHKENWFTWRSISTCPCKSFIQLVQSGWLDICFAFCEFKNLKTVGPWNRQKTLANVQPSWPHARLITHTSYKLCCHNDSNLLFYQLHLAHVIRHSWSCIHVIHVYCNCGIASLPHAPWCIGSLQDRAWYWGWRQAVNCTLRELFSSLLLLFKVLFNNMVQQNSIATNYFLLTIQDIIRKVDNDN